MLRQISYARRQVKLVFAIGALLVLACPAQAGLVEWAFNLDGVFYPDGAALPVTVNTSGFHFDTGLGTIRIDVLSDGSQAFVTGFFDYDLGEPFYTEYGQEHGTPAGGQSWEIGDSVLSGIYARVAGGVLPNGVNGVPSSALNDVSIALAHSFTLPAGQKGRVTFTVTETAPSSGFYLQQTHVIVDDIEGTRTDGSSIYFQSGVESVPEPAALTLVGGGLLLFGWSWRRARR